MLQILSSNCVQVRDTSGRTEGRKKYRGNEEGFAPKFIYYLFGLYTTHLTNENEVTLFFSHYLFLIEENVSLKEYTVLLCCQEESVNVWYSVSLMLLTSLLVSFFLVLVYTPPSIFSCQVYDKPPFLCTTGF